MLGEEERRGVLSPLLVKEALRGAYVFPPTLICQKRRGEERRSVSRNGREKDRKDETESCVSLLLSNFYP